jgi:hypothetical protein
MIRFILICTSTITLASLAAFAEPPSEKAQSIPLEQIWAFNMSGTRDARQIGSPKKSASLVELIQQALGKDAGDGESKCGFIVQGNEEEALRQTFDVLANAVPATQRPTTGEKSWVVFFTRDSGQYVQLQEVQRAGEVIKIRYQFAPHDSREMTRHFAMIPLGELSKGNYRVAIEQCPLEKRFLDMGYTAIPESDARRIVCTPFEFQIDAPNE